MLIVGETKCEVFWNSLYNLLKSVFNSCKSKTLLKIKLCLKNVMGEDFQLEMRWMHASLPVHPAMNS